LRFVERRPQRPGKGEYLKLNARQGQTGSAARSRLLAPARDELLERRAISMAVNDTFRMICYANASRWCHRPVRGIARPATRRRCASVRTSPRSWTTCQSRLLSGSMCDRSTPAGAASKTWCKPSCRRVPPRRAACHREGTTGTKVIGALVISKYADHLPLYRLEQIFERHGVQITRRTLSEWNGAVADLLEPIVRAVHREQVSQSR
jgi:hypothetical protein